MVKDSYTDSGSGVFHRTRGRLEGTLPAFSRI